MPKVTPPASQHPDSLISPHFRCCKSGTFDAREEMVKAPRERGARTVHSCTFILCDIENELIYSPRFATQVLPLVWILGAVRAAAGMAVLWAGGLA